MKTKRTSRARPLIAVTPGEPGGVGPEITARLFAAYRPAGSIAVIVGAYPVLEPWLDRFGAAPPVIAMGRAAAKDPATKAAGLATAADLAARIHAARTGAGSGVVVLDTGRRERFAVGRDSRGGGKHAGFALEAACGLASAGLFEGIVTGPLSKHALHLGGYRFNGHTEYLSRHFHAPDCQMMMVHRKFRVVPLTRHLPLRSVPGALTPDKVLSGLRVVAEALARDFGVARPRLAVSGLNPHAGENGILGSEEAEIIEPALKRARRLGLRIAGPVPGDALFQLAESGTFDAFVALYHDQGLIPFKMVSKRRGVNVTVGLPVVRTSVDHGVAYDIAGRGTASPQSLEAAYRLAETLVRRRRRQKGWRWTR